MAVETVHRENFLSNVVTQHGCKEARVDTKLGFRHIHIERNFSTKCLTIKLNHHLLSNMAGNMDALLAHNRDRCIYPPNLQIVCSRGTLIVYSDKYLATLKILIGDRETTIFCVRSNCCRSLRAHWCCKIISVIVGLVCHKISSGTRFTRNNYFECALVVFRNWASFKFKHVHGIRANFVVIVELVVWKTGQIKIDTTKYCRPDPMSFD
mmetsp:Transcript_2543/g.3734  ORF Transcript_2543/g.3734 Transcript_2543/m.3734 type:complete len:209 (-) Transcript_2543:173-799(-)